MHSKSIVGLVMIGFFGLAGTASASILDGQTLVYQYLFPDTSSPVCSARNDVVAPGVEIAPTGDDCASGHYAFNYSVDYSDTSILVTYVTSGGWAPATFNGFVVNDVNGTIPAFNATLGFTDVTGFDASRLTFDADNIFLNWQDLSYQTGNTIRIDLARSSVPEPTTLLLLGLGLAGLGFARKRLH
jgi:hypothetical protein